MQYNNKQTYNNKPGYKPSYNKPSYNNKPNYNNNKPSYNNVTINSEIFELLKPYMLTLKNIAQIPEKPTPSATIALIPSFSLPKARAPPSEQKPPEEQKPIVVEHVKTVNPVIKPEDTFFSPRQKDSLFWCYFIIKTGFAAYEYPGTTTFAREKEIKFEYITMLRNAKQALKVKKIRNLQEDVEDELANKERIRMKTFIALCIAGNINILFIHKKKCFELILDEEEPIYVIHQRDNPISYCYEMDTTQEAIQHYRKTYFPWESVDKPLKAPSAYKSEELQTLCKKAGVVLYAEGKKKTKKELYDLLLLAI